MYNISMKFKYTKEYLMWKLYVDIGYSIITAIVSIIILKKNWLFYPLAFIISDILHIVIENITFACWKHFYWNKLSTQEKLIKINADICEIDHWIPETDLMCDYKVDTLSILSKLRSNYENKLEDEKTEKIEESENTTNIEINSYIEELKKFKKTLNILISKENNQLFEHLFSKLEQIIDLLIDRPTNSIFVNKIFNIYLPETIALVNKIPKEKSQKKNYVDNIMTVINEIDKLAITTIKTINNFNKYDSDITFDVLVKEIKKSEEDLNGKHSN